MKIQLTAKSLVSATTVCRAAHNQLGGAVRITALKDDTKQLTRLESFDGNRYAKALIPESVSQIIEAGEVFVNLVAISNWASHFPGDSLLSLEVDKGFLLGKCSKPQSRMKFNLIDSHDIPTHNYDSKSLRQSISVDTKELDRAMRLANQAVDRKGPSEAKGGIHFFVRPAEQGDELKWHIGISAANGHVASFSRLDTILTKTSSTDTGPIQSLSCLVSGRDAREVVDALPLTETTLLRFHDNFFELRSATEDMACQIGCSLMATSAIKVEKYFDMASSPRSWFMTKQVMSGALRRALTQCDPNTDGGRLRITPVAKQSDDGSDSLALEYINAGEALGSEIVECSLLQTKEQEKKDASGAIFLSGIYLDKALALFGDNTVYLNDGGVATNGFQRPLVLSDSHPDIARHQFLIMPMSPR